MTNLTDVFLLEIMLYFCSLSLDDRKGILLFYNMDKFLKLFLLERGGMRG